MWWHERGAQLLLNLQEGHIALDLDAQFPTNP